MRIPDFIEYDQQTKTLYCKKEWDLAHVTRLHRALKKNSSWFKFDINIDGKAISKMDSAGAWLLTDGILSIAKKDIHISYQNFSSQHQKLFSLTEHQKEKNRTLPKEHELNWIQRLGKYGIFQTRELIEYINFLGLLFFNSVRIVANPFLWRWNAVVSVINTAGAEALPIIALLSLTIGIVIAYQMGMQLREYGADIFIVDLLGLSILREFGPLITAIMVGGRTGSAFTAQLGMMKINHEIDALTTMGVVPAQILLLPRMAGLFIVVPLLTIWADIFGIIGGVMMAQYLLDIGWHDFLIRFKQEIPLRSLIIGLFKAPVFALIIASIGCFEGIKVRGSAESVGTRTTRSVVLSIFVIILFDGIVSILLSRFKL